MNLRKCKKISYNEDKYVTLTTSDPNYNPGSWYKVPDVPNYPEMDPTNIKENL